MAEPFLAEIRLASFNFPPNGWAFCNGQLLPINQNQALFSLLGTTYGGNGQTNFALPDLRGRHPLGVGDGHTLGERAGDSVHTLSIAEMPQHSHDVTLAAQATLTTPGNNRLATPGKPAYAPSRTTTMHPASVENTGGSQPHNNRSPFLALTFIIALQGIFPSAY
ncbi:phage tail protein [Salinibacterium sp. GXW1014]|uniref:phage tail protein n=1 Tax=Salinibacterium sp. GXW1014 TaxID=3377838 RepID=UPI00383BE72C